VGEASIGGERQEAAWFAETPLRHDQCFGQCAGVDIALTHREEGPAFHERDIDVCDVAMEVEDAALRRGIGRCHAGLGGQHRPNATEERFDHSFGVVVKGI
jgi:hypothetical protein